jgi:hypothetical protein
LKKSRANAGGKDGPEKPQKRVHADILRGKLKAALLWLAGKS